MILKLEIKKEGTISKPLHLANFPFGLPEDGEIAPSLLAINSGNIKKISRKVV